MKQTPLGKPVILFEDDLIVVVNKPCRMLIHRTPLDYYETENLRKWLAEEVGVKIDPVHRLDKPTSGAVIFAKSKEALNFIKEQFLNHTVSKKYIALVRGYTEPEGIVEKPLKAEDSEVLKEATTTYKTIQHVEVPVEVSRYPSSRYSIVEVMPKTGRYHQIRLHFAHLRHPIIGDRRHGDTKHNNMFLNDLGIEALYLHAACISFVHPNGSKMTIHAPFPSHWEKIQQHWKWSTGTGFVPEE
ncbi:MAG: tRNA pseudouridine65 synthase [Flavobacteriales bacterium]|jgi:tRNA pseudouridine65 synthase